MGFIRLEDGSYAYEPNVTTIKKETSTPIKQEVKGTALSREPPPATEQPEAKKEQPKEQEPPQYVEVNGKEDGLPKSLVPVVTSKGAIKCPICTKGNIRTNFANMSRYFEHLKRVHKVVVVFEDIT
jgi:hypothetical protein